MQRFRAVMLANRAAARARQRRWVDALADCYQALELHPGYLKAQKRRGDIYQALGLFSEATADFQAVTKGVAGPHADASLSSAAR